MHMRYGILDVSAGRESLTTLFFSEMHPMRARQLLSYKAAGIFVLEENLYFYRKILKSGAESALLGISIRRCLQCS